MLSGVFFTVCHTTAPQLFRSRAIRNRGWPFACNTSGCRRVQVRVLQQKLAAMDQPSVPTPLDVCGTEAALLGAASSSTLSRTASSAGTYPLGACSGGKGGPPRNRGVPCWWHAPANCKQIEAMFSQAVWTARWVFCRSNRRSAWLTCPVTCSKRRYTRHGTTPPPVAMFCSSAV